MLNIKNLLSKGYFPDDLVPMFNTLELANNISKIPIDNFINKRSTSRSCSFTIPKIKHQRRVRLIPNPLHQILLSFDISKNWDEINNFVLQSKLSISKPVIGTTRSLDKEYRYTKVREQKALTSATSRYLLYTDISRYYPTIYTHSIPWALHGKETAKKNRKHELIGNLLDFRIRNTQDGQTIGIPQGPDTSYLIGEIVATRIDELLFERNPTIKGFRYVDDYYMYFNNTYEAEKVLGDLHSILKEFELEVNPNKTEIILLPEPLESKWVSELRLHRFHKDPSLQYTDLLSYFSKAFEYSSLYPNDSILKYTVSAIEEIKIYEDNWDLYQSLLLQSAISEPSVLPNIINIIYNYHLEGYPLDYQQIEDAINEIICFHSQFNHGFEITWAMFLCKSLNLRLSEKAAKIVSFVDDCFVALCTLDLHSNGNIPSGLDFSFWNSKMIAENLYSQHWILAYEALVKGWLKPVSGRDYTNSDEFFSILKTNNIQFYNTNTYPDFININEPDIDISDTFGRKIDY